MKQGMQPDFVRLAGSGTGPVLCMMVLLGLFTGGLEKVGASETFSSEAVSSAPVSTKPVSAVPASTAPVLTAPASTAPVLTAPVSTTSASAVPVSTAPVSTAPVSTTPVLTAPVSTTSASSPSGPDASALLNAAPTILGRHVQSLSIPGWQSGAPAVWNCSTKTALHLPDGGLGREPILAEYGLQSFSRYSFQRGQRWIYVELYEFSDNAGAFGAYYFLRKGATTVILRGDAASEDESSISFVQGRTFVSIYGTSQDDDESKEVVAKIATLVGAAISEHGRAPEVFNKMPRLELLKGSEKLVMGPQSARRFSLAPFSAQLFSVPVKVACVADYQMREPVRERLRLMVLEYATARDATSVYELYIQALCEAHNQDPADKVNQASNQFRNGSTFLSVEVIGNNIALVTGARKKYSSGFLLRQIH